MKYYVDKKEVSQEEFYDTLEEMVNDFVEENLDDLIDEENEEIHIGSLTYSPSQALRNTDPIAYRCYESDLVDSIYSDYKYDFEHTTDTTEITVCNVVFSVSL